MDDISSIRDLINLWPTRAVFAKDICQVSPAHSVTVHQAHKWAEKGSIPASFHRAVLMAADARGFPVTADLLVLLHDPHRSAPTPKAEDAA